MANPSQGEPLPEYRLPSHIVPHHYDLDVITDLDPDSFTFDGIARITVECIAATDVIKVHARDLTIDNGKVTITPALFTVESLEIKITENDTKNEFFVIKTDKSLVAGQMYSIHLPFHGILKDNLIGFYRSNYFDESSQSVKWLAVTHFEPIEARQAFPCFDEPAMKATFTIRLGHNEKFTSISNMPLLKTSPMEGREGWVWNEFQPTLPMSTYLIAYMVGEFKSRPGESLPDSTVKFQVWARPEALHYSEFAAHVGPHFLSYFESFFGIKYPLPKVDLLAIPDLKIGAMENWGIITFQEAVLLLENQLTSSTTRMSNAVVIAHELAHMWFGNLVTMNWWTDLWLKEGVATYMAGLNVHHKFPEWKSLDISFLTNFINVLDRDSLKSSHPVSVPIAHPNEISQVFDAISYDKGSFLLRMISMFLGEEVFRHGVSSYLVKHQYKNAEQDDLWASLTEQAHRYGMLPAEITVKQIMDTWTLQTGYPLITVKRDYEDRKVTVSQKRFLVVKSNDPGSWWVPLSYSSKNEPHFNQTQPIQWLKSGEESTQFDIPSGEQDWFILNNRAAGLYRVNYDKKNWQLLAEALHSDHLSIDVLNRAQLLIDVLDLAYQGIADYDLAFNIVGYLRNETELVPWKAALSRLNHVEKMLARSSNYGAYKKFIASLLTPLVEKLGNLNVLPESFERAQLLVLVCAKACQLNVGGWGTEAIRVFNFWQGSVASDGGNLILKDIRRAVYTHAVRMAGDQVWDFLWNHYKNANLTTERNNILAALAFANESWLLKRYLKWTIDEKSGIRKQDAYSIFYSVANTPSGYYVAKDFFIQNIKNISEYLGGKSNLIGRYFLTIAGQSMTEYELSELSKFAKTHKELLAPGSLAVSQGLEYLQGNINWMEDHFSNISAILASYTTS